MRTEREKGRMRCKKKIEKEGEEERRGERRIKSKKGGTKSVSPPPDVLPSTKLGNNMTPIKGRLGKNTTPISSDPIKLSHKLQMNPPAETIALQNSIPSKYDSPTMKGRVSKA